jgi:dimethylglycine dehydrogenase
VTEQGTIGAEHVNNAGGLWAKQVGLMAGVDLPVTPMQHHYLVTEDIPELVGFKRELVLTVDLEGFTYLRKEGKGVLLGVNELDPRHWNIEGAPWDYGMDLIPEDIERISPELSRGFERFPCLKHAGIKRWVNGAFTFTPDGNPLVGPVPDRQNYWVACDVMVGFSQSGGVGLSLAQWIIKGEPGADIFGMDVARYGRFASNRNYLKAMTAQFYKRRFVLTYPNERLPVGRPLLRAPPYDSMTHVGARWGVSWGLEVPLYFAPTSFEEKPTQRRSNTHDIIGAECRATRGKVGMLDTSAFSRFEVTGPEAKAWLNDLLACTIPAAGKTRLAPMLSHSGRLMGDLTVLNWDGATYWLMGSYYLRQYRLRWFEAHPPPTGVNVRDISDAMVGFSISGPRSRELVARITPADVSNTAFGFLSCGEMDVGKMRAKVARLSVAGELGYEINVPTSEHSTLYDTLISAAEDLGLVQIGYNALLSLRIEKSFGIWSREYSWAYTAGMSGLDRFVAFYKPNFIGRDAAFKERERACWRKAEAGYARSRFRGRRRLGLRANLAW